MTTDPPTGTPPEPGTIAVPDADAAESPGYRRWLLGALVIGVVVTAAGAALNNAALAFPGALVAAVAVVVYDKTR